MHTKYYKKICKLYKITKSLYADYGISHIDCYQTFSVSKCKLMILKCELCRKYVKYVFAVCYAKLNS